jgi:hypothetical protein
LSYSLKITNVGSWSGTVSLSLPFSAKNISSNYRMLNGTVFATNTNAYKASKAIPVLQSSDTSKIYFWGDATETTYLQWASLAVNDVIYIETDYEI